MVTRPLHHIGLHRDIYIYTYIYIYQCIYRDICKDTYTHIYIYAWGVYRDISPIMENHIEKKTESYMEATKRSRHCLMMRSPKPWAAS